jgi:aspartyl-tRNA(Asn)/glutamyl-tRNA(Gln) amidotransferase subunit C
MALSEEEVRHVAWLSRLELTDDEVRLYARQLGKILEYVEMLRRVDTSDVEPMITATVEGNVFRPDQPRPGLPREEALQAAPEQDGEYFRVPRVIE